MGLAEGLQADRWVDLAAAAAVALDSGSCPAAARRIAGSVPLLTARPSIAGGGTGRCRR